MVKKFKLTVNYKEDYQGGIINGLVGKDLNDLIESLNNTKGIEAEYKEIPVHGRK